MFIKKSELRELKYTVSKLESIVDRLRNGFTWEEGLISCAVCGCAVKKSYAYEAPGVVRKRSFQFQAPAEYIHHDYYCKLHKLEETK